MDTQMTTRTGVMIIGVLGHLATTAMAGAAALKKGLCPPTGMVTALPPLAGLDLPSVQDLVFGGWDIRGGNPREQVRKLLADTGLIPAGEPMLNDADLAAVPDRIFAGTAINCGNAIEEMADFSMNGHHPSLPEIVARLRQDIHDFRSAHGLATVVVINLSSTEPVPAAEGSTPDLAGLKQCLETDRSELLRASTLYTFAALEEGCPYLNFTPSAGALLPGLIELAGEKRLPVMGNDGKTGETLVKTALAPMFACRNLKILSWEGINILGNLDGRILAHPDNAATKIKSKDGVLASILGYRPHAGISINYVPSLGDWKTAWDFIHFEGFLNTRMNMQFTWQGSDSSLAAPLVLDLVRLARFALERGESGLMPHLASFFKAPLGTTVHDLHEQFRLLLSYVEKHLPKEGRKSK